MINKISENVADYFLKNNLVSEDETDVYIYGLQLIISSILGISGVLFCGIMFNKFIDSIIFLVCFITLRQYSGGYHADSYFKCNFYFISTFLITEIAVIFIHASYKELLSFVIFCISFIVLLIYAPVDNKNKRLSNSQKLKNKKISLMIFTMLIVVSILLKITVDIYYFNIAVTVSSVIALMIIQILKGGQSNWKN